MQHINYGFPQKKEDIKKEEILDDNKNEEENMILDDNNIDEKKEEQIDNEENKNNNIENKIKKVCFYCNLIINEEESIQCEKCKNYFHESCVGISHNENEYNDNDNDMDENQFICPDCLSKKQS